MRNILFIVAGFCLLKSSFAQTTNADSNYLKMKDLGIITVSAERFPAKEKYTPKFITVASSEELKQTGANNLIDGLKRIGGLTYKSLGPLGITQGGMNSEVAIRGIKGGELILINGVNVQAASSRSYDLNLISVDQIEKIEIVKGAASTIYGSNAMSGAINIITKKSSMQTKLNLGFEGGNYDYYRTSVSGNYKNLSLSFEYQKIGRIDEVSINYSNNYRYNYDQAKKYNYSLSYNFLKNIYIDYIGAYSTLSYEKVYDNSSSMTKGTNQIQNKNFANLRYEVENLRAKIYTNFDRLFSDVYTSPKTEDTNNKTYNYGADVDYKFDIGGYSFQTGISSLYRAADYNLKYGHKYDIHSALFLQMKKTFANKLDISIGLREQFVNGGSQDKDYDILLPSVGINYNFNDYINSYVSFGKAFRTPTFNNLYYKSDLYEGNSELKPEIGYTYDVGTKFDSHRFTARIAGFYMDYQDKIELDSDSEVKKYVNAGEYKSTGIEWRLDYRTYSDFKIPLTISTSGYYADPIATIDGCREQMEPKLQCNVSLKYYSGNCTLEINSVLTAVREKDLDDYHVFNFFGTYKVWQGNVTIAVDNILDRENQSSGNMTPDVSSRYNYFDLGRQFKLGYQISI